MRQPKKLRELRKSLLERKQSGLLAVFDFLATQVTLGREIQELTLETWGKKEDRHKAPDGVLVLGDASRNISPFVSLAKVSLSLTKMESAIALSVDQEWADLAKQLNSIPGTNKLGPVPGSYAADKKPTTLH